MSFALWGKHEAAKPVHEAQSDGGQLCWRWPPQPAITRVEVLQLSRPNGLAGGRPRPALGYFMHGVLTVRGHRVVQSAMEGSAIRGRGARTHTAIGFRVRGSPPGRPFPDSVVLLAVTSNVISRLLTGEFPQSDTGRTSQFGKVLHRGRRGAVGPSFRSLYETARFKTQFRTRIRGAEVFE